MELYVLTYAYTENHTNFTRLYFDLHRNLLFNHKKYFEIRYKNCIIFLIPDNNGMLPKSLSISKMDIKEKEMFDEVLAVEIMDIEKYYF